jgi:hypothetical protein
MMALPLLGSAFAMGFGFSFAHCLGMCGPLIAAASRLGGEQGDRPSFHLRYSLGRSTSYALLGALAGGLGSVVSLGSRLVGWQHALSLLSGVLLILAGLNLVGWHGPAPRLVLAAGNRIQAGFRGLARVPRWWTPLGLGVLNGLLPCGLVYSGLSLAVATGSIGWGALVMAAFGMGTWPALIALGYVAGRFTLAWRARLRAVGAIAVIAGGLATVWRA